MRTSFSARGQICPFGLSLSPFCLSRAICPYFLISLLFFGKGSSALAFWRTWFCPFTELLCHPHFHLISQSNPILTKLEYLLLHNHLRPSSCPPSDPLQIGGPQEKMSFFQIASGPILSIPFHLKVCQYDPYNVSLKKNDPFLTYEPPKVSVFLH